jgi:hypothetical protein
LAGSYGFLIRGEKSFAPVPCLEPAPQREKVERRDRPAQEPGEHLFDGLQSAHLEAPAFAKAFQVFPNRVRAKIIVK